MSDIAAVIFGLSFIFAMTTLGSLLACFIPEGKIEKMFPESTICCDSFKKHRLFTGKRVAMPSSFVV